MDRESFFGTRSILRQIALLEVELLLSGLERLSVHFLCCRYKYHLISHIYRAPNSPLTMSWQQELESQNLFDVTGFVAVVTGGGSGIGLMATQALAANGARVYIIGRRQEVLERVAQKYSAKGQIFP